MTQKYYAKYLIVRLGSTTGPYIVERAAPGWRSSNADIVATARTIREARRLARAANAGKCLHRVGEDVCMRCVVAP